MYYEYRNKKLVTDDPNPPEWWKRVVHFVEVEIPAVKWMSGCGEVLPEWKMFETKDDAMDAARDDANSASSKGNTWDRAGGSTFRAIYADVSIDVDARNAANAACHAARIASWDAILGTNGIAARDASLMAMAIVRLTNDLDVNDKHRTHAADRWDVWMSGYGLLCDIDGVLYVYRRI